MRDHNLVELRPVRSVDFDFLYMIAADPVTGTTWRFRGITPSPEAFARQLWDTVSMQYVVWHRGTMTPVGITGLYNTNLHARFAYAFAASAPGTTGSGLVTIGTGLLIDHAFDLWNLRKVYFEVPEYNLAQLAGLNRAAVEEGRLRDHEEMRGRHWDHLIFALYQERWPEVSQRLLGLPPR